MHSTLRPHGTKRPSLAQSASHLPVAVGASERVLAPHRTTTDSTSPTIIQIKRARTSTGSTAAARGVLMPLGPKLAARLSSASSNTA